MIFSSRAEDKNVLGIWQRLREVRGGIRDHFLIFIAKYRERRVAQVWEGRGGRWHALLVNSCSEGRHKLRTYLNSHRFIPIQYFITMIWM